MKQFLVGLLAVASLSLATPSHATDFIVHGKRVMIPVPRFLLPPSDSLPDGVMYANPVDRFDEHRPRWRAEGWREGREDQWASSDDRRDAAPRRWRDDPPWDDRRDGYRDSDRPPYRGDDAYPYQDERPYERDDGRRYDDDRYERR